MCGTKRRAGYLAAAKKTMNWSIFFSVARDDPLEFSSRQIPEKNVKIRSLNRAGLDIWGTSAFTLLVRRRFSFALFSSMILFASGGNLEASRSELTEKHPRWNNRCVRSPGTVARYSNL